MEQIDYVDDFEMKNTKSVTKVTSDSFYFDIKKNYSVTTSNVRLESGEKYLLPPVLTFDYDAYVDAPIFHHGIIMLLYFKPKSMDDFFSKSVIPYDPYAYHPIKYVRAATYGGDKYISSGTDVKVELPDNFNPNIHAIGICYLEVENAPFDRINDLRNHTSYLDLEAYSSKVFPIDTRSAAEGFIPLYRGDANGDGNVNLRDVTKMLRFIGRWDAQVIEDYADLNHDRTIDLNDASLAMKLIAGWDLTK